MALSILRTARHQPLGGEQVRDEVFRVVRSNLLVSLADLERPTVLVTSALPGEGKTGTCANLAVALAEAQMRVVAVDMDLRRPSLHARLGGHNDVGLTDVVLGQAPVERALQFVEVGTRGGGLYLLPTGSAVSDPTEMLSGVRTARLLDRLSQQADIVLVDTTPVLPVADTLVIGRMAGGAILVVESRRTPVTAVNQAKNALTRNQTRLLGVVLNKVAPRDLGESYAVGYPASYDRA